MPVIRPATPADALLIGQQRQKMFIESAQTTAEATATLPDRFAAWVRPKLENGTYIGWVAEYEGEPVAGAGLWLMDFPPHWMDPEPVRAYLLNFYVAASFRGHGLAGRFLRLAVDEAHRRNIRVVSLHASKFGRPVYEKHGFKPTNEMMLIEENPSS
ncbi:GNAT family N-acetyltransferase [Granulicella sp. WH15]|uniref:GNAT family N-acetyltransferase n=1 Tax=Granulicella sp. WH15 TaxID=2602070 RepID=UPI00136773AA|nr:GNAT family N-acetyltransferase [Granulicella sp. WH15]QHN04581.1 GNAT family N-acetyltransferase [Granulicella sp. WH15]